MNVITVFNQFFLVVSQMHMKYNNVHTQLTVKYILSFVVDILVIQDSFRPNFFQNLINYA